MSRSDRLNRRNFLQGAAAASAAWLTLGASGCASGEKQGFRLFDLRKEPAELPPPPKPRDSYSDLRVAFIGAGGMGFTHVRDCAKLKVACPCFCDVDESKWAKARELYPDAKPYQDYRVMLEKEAQNLDGVFVATPDHHHYPATILAMQMGKHVYTQKPLTHTPWEARQLTEAAAKYNVVTQMGNQGHAGEGWRRVVSVIRAGILGDIKDVHTWTDRPIWPQGIPRPEGEDKVPANVNWDVWLGPAPVRPYKDKAYHTFNWRGWWDFGCGALGDMGCHTMDGIFWALEPGCPSSVEPVTASENNNDAFPHSSVIKWTFPRRGLRPGFTSYWYDGGLMPNIPPIMEMGRRIRGTGNLFLGTKAAMLVQGDYGESAVLIPETKRKEVGKLPQNLPSSPGHLEEWLMACVGDQPRDFPKSRFEYSGPLTETVLLGNVALRMNRRLEWDGRKFAFTNVPDANAMLTKEYREGWKF